MRTLYVMAPTLMAPGASAAQQAAAVVVRGALGCGRPVRHEIRCAFCETATLRPLLPLSASPPLPTTIHPITAFLGCPMTKRAFELRKDRDISSS